MAKKQNETSCKASEFSRATLTELQLTSCWMEGLKESSATRNPKQSMKESNIWIVPESTIVKASNGCWKEACSYVAGRRASSVDKGRVTASFKSQPPQLQGICFHKRLWKTAAAAWAKCGWRHCHCWPLSRATLRSQCSECRHVGCAVNAVYMNLYYITIQILCIIYK